MSEQIEIPDLDWYLRESEQYGLSGRCPFSSVRACPRYYQSLSLLGEAGATAIPKSKDQRLLNYWKDDELWPQTREQAASISGSDGRFTDFHNFCPEVSFDTFGYFATSMARYTDELDGNYARSHLADIDAPRNDPRWRWRYMTPQHFAACPLYAPLRERSQSHKKWNPVRIDRLLREHPWVSLLVLVAVVVLAILKYFGEISQAVAPLISLFSS